MKCTLLKINGVYSSIVHAVCDGIDTSVIDVLRVCNDILDDNGFIIRSDQQSDVSVEDHEKFNKWICEVISSNTIDMIELTINISNTRIVKSTDGNPSPRNIDIDIKMRLSDLCKLYTDLMDTDSSINTLCEEIFLQLPKANPWFTKDVLISVDG